MKEKLRTAQIFGSNMVLQREKNILIWGYGRKNSTVIVTLNGHKESSKAIECKWSIELPKMQAGGPYIMTISDGIDEICFHNIMIGEVWLAGGQSNMELELQNCKNGKLEVSQADNDNIRFYNVAKIATLEEDDLEEEAKSEWLMAKTEDVSHMSAVAYFFAKELQKELGIAIGIIDCYWGGASISCWLSEERLESDMNAHIYFEEWQELIGDKTIEEYEQEVETFQHDYQSWAEQSGELLRKHSDWTMRNVIEQIGNCPWERPVGYKSPFRPAGLYHTMLERIVPFTVKGVLWYQGEQDADKADIYDRMLYHLIEQWRDDWKDEKLPFYIVQLPMWIEKGAEDDKSWAILRDKQRKIADTVKNVYLTVLIDCGEYDNIHPLEKETVGHRLALQVLKYSYLRKDLYVEGPKYLQRDLKNGRIVLYFDHVYGGFEVRGNEKIALFEIAGDDKTFIGAEAVIENDTIVVSNNTVKNPKYARYGWTNYGIVNLFNAEGLPLAPFVTR